MRTRVCLWSAMQADKLGSLQLRVCVQVSRTKCISTAMPLNSKARLESSGESTRENYNVWVMIGLYCLVRRY